MSASLRNPLRLATRGSQLALWQAGYVASLLAARGVTCVTQVLKTTADRIQDKPLHEIGGKGLFIKELEEALLRGEADLAVHSLKDMTARLDPRFRLACILQRHRPTDLLIFRADVGERLGFVAASAATFSTAIFSTLDGAAAAALPPMTVGTGSLRRRAVLARAAPQLTTVGIRGNVDTRLRKLAAGEWDAIILAEASIERLAIGGLAAARLGPDWFIPCAGQGALAIETRADDATLNTWLAALADPTTTAAVTVERAVLASLGGDCNMPFGCHVRRDGDLWRARAAIYAASGDAAEVGCSMPTSGFSPAAFVAHIASELKRAGAARVLDALGLPVPAAYRA